MSTLFRPSTHLSRGLSQLGRSLFVAGLFAAAVLPACDCANNKGPKSAGVTLDLSPNPADFGEVIVGQQKELKLVARNNGRTPIDIKAIQRGASFPDDFRFSPPNLTLQSGEQQEVQLFFVPAAAGPKSGTLIFADDASGQKTELQLTGVGVTPMLSTNPTSIDFGTVVIGDVKSQKLTVQNTSNGSLDILVDPVVTDHAGAFTFSIPGTDQQTLHLEANASADLSVIFQPLVVGQQGGTLNLHPCASCAPVAVPLTGNAVASGLVADPSPVNFGPVLPRATATKQVTLKNIGSTPITLKGIATKDTSGVFTVSDLPSFPHTLASGDSVQISAGFAPVTMGAQSSAMTFDTDDPRANGVQVPLAGYGGGPVASVKPASLDFGTVAIGFPVTRRLTVSNLGISGSDPTSDTLVISAIDAPAATDFTIASGGNVPLNITPGGRSAIDVQFSPSAAGMQQSTLTLHTNDASHPTITVNLTGEGALVGNCNYELVPAPTPGLQFGVTQRGRSSTLTFSLHNTGVTDCVIGKLELDPSTNAAFTLTNGPVYGQRLAPGDRLFTEVKFAPPGNTAPGTAFAGAVTLNISSANAPTAQIQLSGLAAEVCITITPIAADFGVVKPMCETNDRKFRIYNACNTAVSVTQITPGPGQSDFHVILPPTFPVTLDPQTVSSTTGMGTTSTTFSVRYHPTDVGADVGTVQVFTDEQIAGGQPYVVSLSGRGDNNATATETFVQADRAETDILIVADDSGSMASKQDKLAKNYDNFIQFALSQQIDYHIAVTTTGTSSSPDCTAPEETINGRFMPLTGPDRIITPQTANPEATFVRNVNVGTNGCGTEQGLEGAYLALTDPDLNGTNAGFLRPEAYLAIIIVSDADDQSFNRTLDFYQDFFQNLKGPNGANLVSVSAIADTDESICQMTGVDTEMGGAARYIEMARRTGGIARSICLLDWAQALRDIGLTAFGFKSRFVLSSEPDPTTIQVTVDGMPAPDGSWSFTPDSNSIDFLPTYIPPAHSTIDVSYTVACH